MEPRGLESARHSALYGPTGALYGAIHVGVGSLGLLALLTRASALQALLGNQVCDPLSRCTTADIVVNDPAPFASGVVEVLATLDALPGHDG